jgi:cytochrome b pre-mRNA-processing protein 3
MILARALRRWLPQKSERAVYESIVAAARHPRLYESYGVPDTVDGRFEMISLHAILTLRSIASVEGEDFARFRQDLVNEIFRDMDRSLREMGTGDLSVGKKVRKMAEVFYGRLKAYGEALEAPEGVLEDALDRNLWSAAETAAGAGPLAQYLRSAEVFLKTQDPRLILDGTITFMEPT